MKEELKKCDIEYYPINKQYYCRYKKKYIRLWESYGQYHLSEDNHIANSFDTKEEAKDFLLKFVEHKGWMKNTKIIKPFE